MQETLFQHPKLTARHVTGTDGPRHDPYAWAEFRVVQPCGETVLHQGIETWVRHCGLRITPHTDDIVPQHLTYEQKEKWLRNVLFPALIGYTVEQLLRIRNKRLRRCRQCGSTERKWERGFPGEHFMVCCGCNAIVDGYFCEGEVM